MTFTLRIFFMGLIAFVPSRDGKELTVLLVETRPGHVASDGSLIAPHQPMLLARAADCRGHCETEDPTIAGFFFPGGSAPGESLSAALGKGAVWKLDSSDLSILAERETSLAPLTMQSGGPDRSEDFSSVADLGRIVSPAGIVDPDVLASRPPKRLIAARLRLRSGRVWTYRFVQDCIFKALRDPDGEGKATRPRPLADWVAAEIEISGDTVEIVENPFGREAIRTIRLAPQDGLVELAVMNIPPPPTPPPGGGSHPAHKSAAHFERYYDLALNPPPPDQRPVPHVPGQSPPPPFELRSKLLEGLTGGDPKGFYERILCPPALLSEGGNP